MSTTEDPGTPAEEEPQPAATEEPQPEEAEAEPETPTAYDPVTGEQVEVDPAEHQPPVAYGDEGEAPAEEKSADE